MTADTPPLRLLLGEDNPADTKLIELCLESVPMRHRLLRFTHGDAVQAYLFQLLQGEAPPPDLIMLDFFLIGMQGPRLLQWIRQHTAFAAIPVVLMSGSYLEEVRNRSYELGANYFLEKSIDPEAFFAEVIGIIQFCQRQRTSPLLS